MYAAPPKIIENPIPELTLNGSCGYTIQNGQINIKVGEIANHRDFGNVSGTLSLELWALKQPYAGGDFNGVSLAGTALGEIYGQHFILDTDFNLAFQEPPAGDWYLTLMLREWNGVAYETCDFINFAVPYSNLDTRPTIVRSEKDNVINVSFTETKKVTAPEADAGNQLINEYSVTSYTSKPASDLTLSGNCGYIRDNDRIVINVGEIANHRDIGNISGTLSVELWALTQAYNGDDFSGVALAGTSIGELYGQHIIQLSNYELEFHEPAAGTWHLTLMLREWNGAAYETRDFINFAIPYTVEAKPAIVRKEPDNIINVRFAENKKPEAAVSAEKAKPVVATPKPVVAETSEPVVATPKPVVAETSKPVAAEVKQPIAPQAKPIPKVTIKQEDTVTSLNEVNIACLTTIKGVPKKTAENIVAAQPFDSFDELSKVKGVGPNLLKKLRKLFTL